MNETCAAARLVAAPDLVLEPFLEPATRRPAIRRLAVPRLTGSPALYLLASLIVSLLAASAAPTPLYATYAGRGLAVRFLPAPTHLIYLALLGVLVAQASGVALMRETVTRSPGALASLVPDVRLPRSVRPALLAAAPVLFAVWALAGLYGALGPALVQALTGSADVVLGGLSLTVLTAAAVGSIFALRAVAAREVLLTGIGALVAGVAVTLLALTLRSPAVFFAGTAISGVGFGSGFQGGIRLVVPRAAPHERAGVLSLLFVVSYLGMGIPEVAAGFLAVHGAGLVGAARYYGAALIVLALLALSALLRERRNS
jgi:hypothetical protein